jgi:hypothetical protein
MISFNRFYERIQAYKDKDITFDYDQDAKPYPTDETKGGSGSDPREKITRDALRIKENENTFEPVIMGEMPGESKDFLDGLPSRLMKTMTNDIYDFSIHDPEFGEGDGEGTSEKALNKATGFFSGLKEVMKNDWNELIEEIYFNEYIMQTMKNAVTGSNEEKINVYGSGKEEMAAKEYFDIRGNLIRERSSYFKKGEAEYIIVGNRSEAVNISVVKSEILAIRFAMNLLGAYMDKSKTALASTIAPFNGRLDRYRRTFDEDAHYVCMGFCRVGDRCHKAYGRENRSFLQNGFLLGYRIGGHRENGGERHRKSGKKFIGKYREKCIGQRKKFDLQDCGEHGGSVPSRKGILYGFRKPI